MRKELGNALFAVAKIGLMMIFVRIVGRRKMKQRFENRVNLPMSEKHIELIRQGVKTTTLRGLRYSYPIETIFRFYNEKKHGRDEGVFVIVIDKKMLKVPDGLTEEICKSEGNYTKEELIGVLKNLGFRLPNALWLYTFILGEKHLKKLAEALPAHP